MGQEAAKGIERAAIIRGVGIGCRDTSTPMLWFNVYLILQKNVASLQCLSWEQAFALMKKHQIRDAKDLNGRSCIVIEDGASMAFKDLVDV